MDGSSTWVGTANLPAGAVEIALVHELTATSLVRWPDSVVDSSRLGVDIAVAVTPRLTIGLTHSSRGQGTVDRGGGWCHVNGAYWCQQTYAGVLFDARWRVHDDSGLVVSMLGRAGVIGAEPLQPVMRFGLAMRMRRPGWWAAADPEVQISLGHRELGSRDTLIAPVWIGVGRRRIAAWLHTGLRSQMVAFVDNTAIPAVLGGAVRMGCVRLGFEAGWPALAGRLNTGRVQHTSLWLATRW